MPEDRPSQEYYDELFQRGLNTDGQIGNQFLVSPERPVALPELSADASLASKRRALSRFPLEPTSPLPTEWTTETLAEYVQLEFRHLLSRIIRLEELLPRIAMSPEVAEISKPSSGLSTPSSKEISRGQLDKLCLPVLQETPEPSAAALNDVCLAMEALYPHLDRKSIISQVRKWFRKRREEMGARILSAFKRQHSSRLVSEDSKQEVLFMIEQDRFDLAEIISEARLELTNPEAVRLFAKRKCISFLKRFPV